MHSVCEKAADLMVQNEVISSEDKEIYVYGLKQGFILLVNILTTLMIGLLFNKVFETIIFLVTYMPLRIYAGGYHARTQLRCYICSVVLIISALLAIEYIPWTNFIVITISTVSGMIIYILSPVEDMNKSLDVAEVKMYGKKTRVILFVEFIVVVLLIIYRKNNASQCVSVSLLVLCVMLGFWEKTITSG